MLSSSRWNQYIEGLHVEWSFSFSMQDMQSFAALSGDYNPIHSDIEFAKSKGFQAPLIYGLLLSSQISRLVGQELPDKCAILTGIKMDFMAPCFPGDDLIFVADLTNKSDATHALEFKCHISRGGKKLCRGGANAIWRL
jgi:3-hydroxybutyryl-CoA dehydratase